MAAFFLYSFKLSVCLGVIYVFYYLVLRNLTFFNWNRWFLLMGTGMSLIIPLVPVLPFLNYPEAGHLGVIRVIPTLTQFSSPVYYFIKAPAGFAGYISGEYLVSLLPLLFGTGMLLRGCRLVMQFISFSRILQSATRLYQGNINIYQVNKNIAPFSFGNAVFLNKDLLQPAELQEIIRHEQVHISQKHTVDVLWMEVLSLVNWYNPFVWLLKKAVRQNLEFIADRVVLQAPGADKKYYQYLLLKVIGISDFNIAHQFNISSLKTRIIMMNRMPSNQYKLAKFLFVLPLMAILLLACQKSADITMAELKQTVPPPPPPALALPPPPPPVVLPISADHELFMKRNPQVELLGWEGDKTMVLFLKSGEREAYDLNNTAKRAIAEKKYGELPQKPELPASGIK